MVFKFAWAAPAIGWPARNLANVPLRGPRARPIGMRTFGTIDSSSNLIHMLQRCGLFSPLNIPNRPRLGMYVLSCIVMYCHVLSCIVMYCLRLKSSTSRLAFAYPAGPLCKTSEAPCCTSFLWNDNPFKKKGNHTPRDIWFRPRQTDRRVFQDVTNKAYLKHFRVPNFDISNLGLLYIFFVKKALVISMLVWWKV